MRSPLHGLACALIAAACSTDKPAENPASATVARDDVTVTEPGTSELETTPPAESDQGTAAKPQPVAATAPATIGEDPRRTTETNRTDPGPAPSSTPPDNTKINQRDTSSVAKTPLDQGENATDLKVTQQIRQAVMADGSLSFTAKNVKIITANRRVTLRGPVKTEAERTSIDAAARKIAGASMVDNLLEVVK